MEFKTKKFWKEIVFDQKNDLGFILLDGVELKSPNGKSLNLPKIISEKVYLEWKSVVDEINPQLMPFYSYSVTAVDRVLTQKNYVVSQLEDIFKMDLLCYRSGNDNKLKDLQDRKWQPIMDWLERKFGVQMLINYELMPKNQNEDELNKSIKFVQSLDHFSLAAFHHIVSITGSFILGLAYYFNKCDADKLFELAFIEELYQIKKWGDDDLAKERREKIFLELKEACMFINCLPKKDY